MNLQNIRILIAAQYSAPYEGNFISSMKALESKLKKEFNASVAYVFPVKTKAQPWSESFSEGHKVYYSGDDRKLIYKRETDDILNDFNPDLIYTHFEGYDVPLNKAVRRSKKNIRQIWHMRDTLTYQKNLAKKLYQIYCYFFHYGYPNFRKKSNSPAFLANCKDELQFIKPYRLGRKASQIVIHNGVDLNRVTFQNDKRNHIFTFIAYGGRNVQKRIDILLKAGNLLSKENIKFKIILTKGTDTEEVVRSIFLNVPEWLELTNQVRDLNPLMAKGDCFMITSVHETFCNAIIEASLAGLPVLRTEIPGTAWSRNLCGIISYEKEDEIAMVDAMKKIINKPFSDIIEDNRTAVEEIRKEYSMGAWSYRIVEFFKSLD